MKSFYLTFLVPCMMGIAGISGCQSKNTGDPAPDTGCRIEKYTATVKNAANTTFRSEQAAFTYDAQGNLVRVDSSWTDSGSGNSTSNTLTTYAYDAEGFLTAGNSQTSVQTSLSQGGTVKNQRSVRSNFEYTQGRVSAYVTHLKSFSGLETTIRGTFDYDASGELVKQTAVYTYQYNPDQVKEVPLYTNGLQRTWIYVNKELADYYETEGTKQERPYTIEKGMVMKETRPGYTITFEYDAQGRMTRQVMNEAENINYYYTQEWAEGKPAINSLPAWKGFPQIPAPFGTRGILRKFEFYGQVSGAGLTQLTSHNASHQLNGHSFITNLNTAQQNLYPDNGTQSVIKTEVFAYTGCR